MELRMRTIHCSMGSGCIFWYLSSFSSSVCHFASVLSWHKDLWKVVGEVLLFNSGWNVYEQFYGFAKTMPAQSRNGELSWGWQRGNGPSIGCDSGRHFRLSQIWQPNSDHLAWTKVSFLFVSISFWNVCKFVWWIHWNCSQHFSVKEISTEFRCQIREIDNRKRLAALQLPASLSQRRETERFFPRANRTQLITAEKSFRFEWLEFHMRLNV